jgi:hypothetical protein
MCFNLYSETAACTLFLQWRYCSTKDRTAQVEMFLIPDFAVAILYENIMKTVNINKNDALWCKI